MNLCFAQPSIHRVLVTLRGGRRAWMAAEAAQRAFPAQEPEREYKDAPAGPTKAATIRTGLGARLLKLLTEWPPEKPLEPLAALGARLGTDAHTTSHTVKQLQRSGYIAHIAGGRSLHRGERVIRIVSTGRVLRSANAPAEWVL